MNTLPHRLTEAGHQARAMLKDFGRTRGNAAFEVAVLALATPGTSFTTTLLAAELVRLTGLVGELAADSMGLDTESVDVVG